MAKSARTIDVADRLHSAAIHLLRQVAREDVESGLSAARLSALSVVVFGGPLTLGALAAAERVQPPTITRVVQALERDGLVERRSAPDDRRAVLVRATRRGTRVLQTARRRRVARLAEALARAEDADVSTLERAAELIERLVSDWPADGAS